MISVLNILLFEACAGLALFQKTGQWQNYQGQTLCSQTSNFAYPKSVQDVSQIVQYYEKVSAVGAGHSWSAFACAGQALTGNIFNFQSVQIYMTGLSQIIGLDSTDLTVTVEAGVI